MKRRSWLWFVVSAILAVAAGAVAIIALFWAAGRQQVQVPVAKQAVVVARNPIAANSIIRADQVTLEERDQIPSGAVVTVSDVLGQQPLRDVAEGEVLRTQDLQSIEGQRSVPLALEDKIAVALPADDILSQWGAVMPGDHVDLLFTLDVILETPMYPAEVLQGAQAEAIQALERDQSLDNVAVLTLQNLEVLQIIEEPQVQTETPNAQQQTPLPLRRALVLKMDPQDAVLLKYFRDSAGKIDVALRSPDNGALFATEPVNINYLMLRYGISLPQPLQ